MKHALRGCRTKQFLTSLAINLLIAFQNHKPKELLLRFGMHKTETKMA